MSAEVGGEKEVGWWNRERGRDCGFDRGYVPRGMASLIGRLELDLASGVWTRACALMAVLDMRFVYCEWRYPGDCCGRGEWSAHGRIDR